MSCLEQRKTSVETAHSAQYSTDTLLLSCPHTLFTMAKRFPRIFTDKVQFYWPEWRCCLSVHRVVLGEEINDESLVLVCVETFEKQQNTMGTIAVLPNVAGESEKKRFFLLLWFLTLRCKSPTKRFVQKWTGIEQFIKYRRCSNGFGPFTAPCKKPDRLTGAERMAEDNWSNSILLKDFHSWNSNCTTRHGLRSMSRLINHSHSFTDLQSVHFSSILRIHYHFGHCVFVGVWVCWVCESTQFAVTMDNGRQTLEHRVTLMFCIVRWTFDESEEWEKNVRRYIDTDIQFTRNKNSRGKNRMESNSISCCSHPQSPHLYESIDIVRSKQ